MMTRFGKRALSWPKVWGLFLLFPLLAGCAISPGNKLTLFPQGHTLLDATKAMRAAVPEPLDLPRELNKQVLSAYRVEPGDTLLVLAVDASGAFHLPADQPILPDGAINLGRFGRLLVAGKTVDEVEADIRATVAAQLKDQAKEAGTITVRLVNRVSKVFYVLGEVNTPGAFPLAGRETVLDAILIAGGLNDRASRRNIILARPTPPNGCRVVLPICYSEIVQLGDTSTNYQIAPGDRIYIPSRAIREDCWSGDKKNCPPCGRPQVPCGAVEGCSQGVPAPSLPINPASPATLPAALPPAAATLEVPTKPEAPQTPVKIEGVEIPIHPVQLETPSPSPSAFLPPPPLLVPTKNEWVPDAAPSTPAETSSIWKAAKSPEEVKEP